LVARLAGLSLLVELEGIEPSSADDLLTALRPFPDYGLR